MRLTGNGIWGEPANTGQAKALLRRAVDLGVNLIDTSDAYGPFISERLIAEALSPFPDGLVVATKGGLIQDGPGQWHRDGHPNHIKLACEESLRRLQTEQITLYQLHFPDPEVPFSDTLGALADLQAEGKIRHIGLCNVSATQLEEALALIPVASVQNRYSVQDRRADDILQICEEISAVFLPWAPLEQGGIGRDDSFVAIANRLGVTAHQLSIAWLLARSPAMVPIPATSSIDHLIDNLDAGSIAVQDDDLASINALTSTGQSRSTLRRDLGPAPTRSAEPQTNDAA
jgi:aryl-alcohol dehydrogenase-like predicted oxidoreductase